MHTESIEQWVHDHTFGQDAKKAGERRTLIVIIITAVTMIVEIAAGIAFGSMALLADGLHMASHASALGIAVFAYYYTRRHAKDTRFSFGTGKVNSLGAFASALLLVLFALIMAGESIERFISPVRIQFNQAILVAVLGLVVNGVCLVILGGHGHSHKDTGHGRDEGHQHAGKHPHGHGDHDHHRIEIRPSPVEKHKDLNLWAAYLHVLADALTSLSAVFALLLGKYLGQNWLDPFMGLVGAALVVRWSWGLVHTSAGVLLDVQAPEELRDKIKTAIESNGDNRVSDLHVWSVGPGIYAAEIAVVSSQPLETDYYYELLPRELGLVHVTVETRRCESSTSHADSREEA